ncbi:MAG: glycerol-3-phosphate 1-O-acyltransferase PlsY [Limisphaerales bacterium]
MVPFSVIAIAAYLLGSIPTGYLVARARGIDIRTVGSGNIGATNVIRILGKGPGAFVLVVDALKGFAACWCLAPLAGGWFDLSRDPTSAEREYLAIAAGVAAILGHNYTCWLKFKGGKGIATSAGVMLALLPGVLALALLVWVLVFAFSRYVSLASITAAFCLPFAAGFTGRSNRLIGVAVIIGALAIYKHKPNIQRLLKGTEHRFGAKRRPEPSPPTP